MLKEFTSGWQDGKVLTVNTEGLTDNEVAVLIASRINEFGDCIEYGQWSFSVCDYSQLSEKVYRGVVSSLIKKGYATVSDDEGKGKFNDMVFWLTDAGKALFGEKVAVKFEKANKTMSTADLVAFAKENNIAWKEDSNELINRMRVTMSLKKANKYNS